MGRGRGRSAHPPVLKKYGQHFLTDPGILTAIVDALAPGPDDTVVEIGPGRGSLTDVLVERAGRVIAVEVDHLLAGKLRERYASRANVQIVEGDILETNIEALAGPDFLIIGNVPYYITTPIIFRTLEPPLPRRAVFLVQREVAERMTSHAGAESYGALTVNVATVARAEIVMGVPRSAFKPAPKVDSSVVRLTPRASALIDVRSLKGFRTFVQAVFGLRRKQIQRVVRTVSGLASEETTALLDRLGIDSAARPEVLTPETFVRLFRELRSSVPAVTESE
ncbi:MAG TPA: 16S rRNA (adenine(1518)-N(6)/adenine(1519)-N(6))-dimethyltransferase RsmA [Gemmatimonadaceae bacterium]|nr:16S rRNA (adenine(1518)-N(6)/adenine(1519)-N(6))-dimethyltransferase RsmA [Gemmatimonadaceae bacterium]